MNKIIRKEFRGCNIEFAITNLFCDYLIVTNSENTTKFIDFSEIPIKLNDWYYFIPIIIRIGPYARQAHSLNMDSSLLIPTDNLTYVEQLAKERNLI